MLNVSIFSFIISNLSRKVLWTLHVTIAADIRRVTRAGQGGEVSSALFQKLETSALILGKNALIVVIYGLNLSFKMHFLKVSRNKSKNFPCWAKFLSRVVHDYLSKCPNPKKTPLP